MIEYSTFVKPIIDIITSAGEIILQYYDGEIETTLKADNSPVTKADIAANEYIISKLKKISNITIISEEEINQAVSLNQTFWLVDPLDGTKSFIKHTDEFTVNIGLIKNQIPVFGAVYVPVTKELYYTGEDGKAYKKVADESSQLISVRDIPEDGMTVVASKSHITNETKAYIEKLPVKDFKSASSSLKFCLLAEGKADIYPRFGLTMEWDTAAAHAILLAAGGSLEKTDGSKFIYAKTRNNYPETQKDYLNTFFIARGKKSDI